MRTMSIILFLASFIFNNPLFAKIYYVTDNCTNQKTSFKTFFKTSGDDEFTIKIVDEKEGFTDSISFKGLAWEGSINIIDDKWINLSLPLKGGSGLLLKKSIILVICKKKIKEVLNIFSNEYFESKIPIKESEKYLVEFQFFTNPLRLKLSEEYSLISTQQKTDNWKSTCMLKYSEKEDIFYTDSISLKEAKVYGELYKVTGTFPAVFVRKYNYVFIKGSWYILNEKNLLYK